jgi:hypothetical protein
MLFLIKMSIPFTFVEVLLAIIKAQTKAFVIAFTTLIDIIIAAG